MIRPRYNIFQQIFEGADINQKQKSCVIIRNNFTTISHVNISEFYNNIVLLLIKNLNSNNKVLQTEIVLTLNILFSNNALLIDQLIESNEIIALIDNLHKLCWTTQLSIYKNK